MRREIVAIIAPRDVLIRNRQHLVLGGACRLDFDVWLELYGRLDLVFQQSAIRFTGRRDTREDGEIRNEALHVQGMGISWDTANGPSSSVRFQKKAARDPL